MQDYERADIVIMQKNGIYKIVKSRFTVPTEGKYITEQEMVNMLNYGPKVAVCNAGNRVFEKNFKGAFSL
ncbi:hypothetical protein [Peribacillus asahii]|uniref:hypothetical protein n=1 Tax=Peribacillus asahii TaxID=228899 RepID=UPI0038097BE8